MVTGHELNDLRRALARGERPPDLAAKLAKLSGDDLARRFVAQHCRLFIELLAATQEGTFCDATSENCERLLRVLAYVRKDDDAIPDYRPDGFVDDQQEVRAASVELNSLLQGFKAWRLRHQVPAMWRAGDAGRLSVNGVRRALSPQSWMVDPPRSNLGPRPTIFGT